MTQPWSTGSVYFLVISWLQMGLELHTLLTYHFHLTFKHETSEGNTSLNPVDEDMSFYYAMFSPFVCVSTKAQS